MKHIFIILLSAAIANAGVLLTNGDIELVLGTGWSQASSGANIIIDRATTYDPDPDYEARVYKGSGSGYARLFQMVDIPTTDLEFSVYAKIYAYDNHSTAWCGAGVIISYLNENGVLLGDTRICMRSTQCPWSNSSTRHIIQATDSMWHNYAFNIDNELTNLSGVNPSDVKKIEVALFDSTYHC
jgi:hypothetical protein